MIPATTVGRNQYGWSTIHLVYRFSLNDYLGKDWF